MRKCHASGVRFQVLCVTCHFLQRPHPQTPQLLTLLLCSLDMFAKNQNAKKKKIESQKNTFNAKNPNLLDVCQSWEYTIWPKVHREAGFPTQTTHGHCHLESKLAQCTAVGRFSKNTIDWSSFYLVYILNLSHSFWWPKLSQHRVFVCFIHMKVLLWTFLYILNDKYANILNSPWNSS